MNALAFGLAATVLGIAVHLLALRKLSPKQRLLSLPMILVTGLMAIVLTLPPPDGVLRAVDCLVALVICLSLGFAYALMLNGVLYDSPTLALVNAIDAYGPAGMPIAEFDSFVSGHPFVQSRLNALVAAGELGLEGGELRITGKAVYLLQIGDVYRSVRGGSSPQSG